jgi:hypothetical protein
MILKPKSHQNNLDCSPIPEFIPLPHDNTPHDSSLSVSIIEGPTLNLWFNGTVSEGKIKGELALKLQPDQSVIIGRQEGGQIEYLDPRYQPTRMVPNSSRPVVTSLKKAYDICVSRGHFMLKGSLLGILLVNGVPRRGGGIRPPKNGTVMLEPSHRSMDQGEEYLIERGRVTRIRLPNGTVILIAAD